MRRLDDPRGIRASFILNGGAQYAGGRAVFEAGAITLRFFGKVIKRIPYGGIVSAKLERIGTLDPVKRISLLTAEGRTYIGVSLCRRKEVLSFIREKRTET